MRRRAYDLVFFDCDSTLSTLEGVDELAVRAGAGEELAAMTRGAMDGSLPIEDVYRRRLEAIRPTRADLEWLGARYVETVVDGARELTAALRRMGCELHVVSGGLEPAVRTLAAELGFVPGEVHAVPLRFDEAGRYAGFDAAHPLARRGGKAEVCRRVIAGRPLRAAIVGDGATDLEAGAVCDAVFGFGGVAAREAVRRGATAFIEERSLLALLPLLTKER